MQRFACFPAVIAILVVCILLVFSHINLVNAGKVLIDSPMDTPFRSDGANKGLAPGWTRNCYGKNSVDFLPGKPREGNASQKIECHSHESGADQFYYPLPVEKGKHYRITFWARASGSPGDVKVILRQGPKPYRQHASGRFEAGLEWERFTIDCFVLCDDKTAGLYFSFSPNGPCTLWIWPLPAEQLSPRAKVGRMER